MSKSDLEKRKWKNRGQLPAALLRTQPACQQLKSCQQLQVTKPGTLFQCLPKSTVGQKMAHSNCWTCLPVLLTNSWPVPNPVTQFPCLWNKKSCQLLLQKNKHTLCMSGNQQTQQWEGINRTDCNDERAKLNVSAFKCLTHGQGQMSAETKEKKSPSHKKYKAFKPFLAYQ